MLRKLLLQFLKNRPLFRLFSLPSKCKDKSSTNMTLKNKCIDGVLGLEPRAAECKGQTNPLNYVGIP